MSRWESSVKQFADTFRAVTYQAIVPAAERIVLWLEQMKGWSMTVRDPFDSKLDKAEIDQLIALAQQLIMKSSQLERAAGVEEHEFVEFHKFLKYGEQHFYKF